MNADPGTARALLQGGPHDGETKTIPDCCDIIAFGDHTAAMWADEGTPIPGAEIITYRHVSTQDDGLRIYTYTEPTVVPAAHVIQCPICFSTGFGMDADGMRYCLTCPWDEA